MRGGCRNIRLPRKLKNKKALIQINSNDEFCFLHAIAAKLFPAKYHAERASHYKKYIKLLNTGNLKFPLSVYDVDEFENLNNLKINIFGFYENEVFTLRLSKRIKPYTKEIDLLFYQNHFFLIKNFQRLVSSKNEQKYYCRRCLNGFRRLETLVNHEKLCSDFTPQRTAIPSEKIVKFKNFSKMLFHPYCVYADFECMTQKISTVLPSTSQSYTIPVEQHIPISYSILAINVNDEIIFHEFFTGLNAVDQFLETLKKTC